jgi:hypothetical protein
MRLLQTTWNDANWHCRPVGVDYQRWTFFDDIPARPEICFEVAPFECQWQTARVRDQPQRKRWSAHA